MTTIPEDVIAAARAAQTKWRIPAAVSIAQWAIESGWGQHSPGNNCFGMKCRAGRGDAQQMLMTTEHSAARGYYKIAQRFRAFATIASAFDAHAELIATAPVYGKAMAALPDVPTFINRMAAHYATDPLYAAKIKGIIAGHSLGQFNIDMGAAK